MNFVLFLMLNAILLIRPEELFPDIAGLHLYYISIVLCAVLNAQKLIELLTWDSLRQRPVSVCVLIYFGANVLSLCVLGRTQEAFFEHGLEFAKVILYYFLLLAVVDTRERFRTFVGFLTLLIGVLTAVALINLYEIHHFSNIIPCQQTEIDPASGEQFILPRLVSTGIFNDPNDLCLVLGLGILSCVYCAATSDGWAGWFVWLLPIPLFVFALFETHSRGGFVGVLAGGAAYIYSKYGGPKSLPFAAIGVVVVLAVAGGRQASLEGGGTAHQRVMSWADGLRGLVSQPLYLPTGLGVGWFVSETELVAHNSFVQAYVEQGILGGGAFLAAFLLSARLVDRIGRGIEAPDWVVQARPFAFAALGAYAMGCYSITRNFVVPTYLTLGLVSVLLDQAAETLPEKYRVNGRWLKWVGIFAVAGLVVIKFATQALGLAGV